MIHFTEKTAHGAIKAHLHACFDAACFSLFFITALYSILKMYIYTKMNKSSQK